MDLLGEVVEGRLSTARVAAHLGLSRRSVGMVLTNLGFRRVRVGGRRGVLVDPGLLYRLVQTYVPSRLGEVELHFGRVLPGAVVFRGGVEGLEAWDSAVVEPLSAGGMLGEVAVMVRGLSGEIRSAVDPSRVLGLVRGQVSLLRSWLRLVTRSDEASPTGEGEDLTELLRGVYEARGEEFPEEFASEAGESVVRLDPAEIKRHLRVASEALVRVIEAGRGRSRMAAIGGYASVMDLWVEVDGIEPKADELFEVLRSLRRDDDG